MALLQDRQAWLLGQAEQRQESMKQLDNYFKQRTTLLSYTPSIWPVRGWTTSEFGIRRDPYTSRARMHRGLDIAAAIGTTVNSPADGLIIFTGKDGAFGKVVVVDHKNNIMTRYAHLSRIDVTTGDQVKRGEQLGAVGNTGRSTGPHLHYEVWINGIPENPRKYILN